MVAVTLMPVEVTAGFGLESVQLVPVGVSTITQPSATLPVNPFKPFTTMVSPILVPTLVATVAVLAVTEKSFTESVTLFDRVIPMPLPQIAIVELAAGVA